MHKSSYLRMQWFFDNYCKDFESTKQVLDVGSYDVNGCYKLIFPSDKFSYTGLDMEDGPNVDVVVRYPYNWKELKDEQFDIVISGQAFEHTEFFWETMKEMVRVLKVGGLVSLIAPHGFGYHGYPIDCYRFWADGLVALARYTGLEVLHASSSCAPLEAELSWYQSGDSFLIARKNTDSIGVDVKSYVFEKPDFETLKTGFVAKQDALRVSLSEGTGALKKSISNLQKAVELNPNDPRLRDALQKVLEAQKHMS